MCSSSGGHLAGPGGAGPPLPPRPSGARLGAERPKGRAAPGGDNPGALNIAGLLAIGGPRLAGWPPPPADQGPE